MFRKPKRDISTMTAESSERTRVDRTRHLHPVLKNIFDSGKVTDHRGRTSDLRYSVDLEEGFFLQNLIDETRPHATIEIGCAHGISSIFICEELRRQQLDTRHVIIDPHQTSSWGGKGVAGLRRAGLDNFDLFEEPSEICLPRLLAEGRRFDFAFIDGWHTFDHTMVDFFYINRMLNVNGIAIFDDVSMPAIRRCVRYILNYPSYNLKRSVNPDKLGWKWRLLERARWSLSVAAKFTLPRVAGELFDQRVLVADSELGINATMIALQKNAEDQRSHDWYRPF